MSDNLYAKLALSFVASTANLNLAIRFFALPLDSEWAWPWGWQHVHDGAASASTLFSPHLDLLHATGEGRGAWDNPARPCDPRTSVGEVGGPPWNLACGERCSPMKQSTA